MHTKVIKQLLFVLALLMQGSTVFAAYVPGQTPPAPTALQQGLASTTYATGFRWTPVTLPWLTNGSQIAFGGAIDTTTRLTISPQNAGEKGLVINMPTTSTDYFTLTQNGSPIGFKLNLYGDLISSHSIQSHDVSTGSIGAATLNADFNSDPNVQMRTNGSGARALGIKSSSGQTADIMVWQDSTNAVQAKVDAAFKATFPVVNAATGFQVNGVSGLTTTLADGTAITGGIVTTAPTLVGTDTQTLRYNGAVLAPTSNHLMNTAGQTAFGGAIDTTSRLSVNPQGTGENGLTVKMPSGATGYAWQVKNSTGALLASINAAGLPDFPGATPGSQCIGAGAIVGTRSVAIGSNASATGDVSLVVGEGSNATTGGTAIGPECHAQSGIAVGLFSTSTGGGTAIGTSSSAASDAFAIGRQASAGYSGSMAFGYGASTTASHQFVLGTSVGAYSFTDVYLGQGVTVALPANTTIHADGGSGTNITGGSLTISGGTSTGSAAGGSVFLATSSAGSTGTAANTLVQRVAINKSGLTILTGSLSLPVRVVTATDTATLADSVLLCNGTFTETLPATGWPTGYRLTVKDTGTGTITLTAGGTVTFDGATTMTFATQYKSRVLIFDGVNFQVESGLL